MFGKCVDAYTALTYIVVSSAIGPTETDELQDHIKLAIISSQLRGSGNQNPEWKRKLKTFQKTPAEECCYSSCMLSLLYWICSTLNIWPFHS